MGGWGAGQGEIFSLLTLRKAHFGGYLMHSDVHSVQRMLQGCATDSLSVFSDRLQFMVGLSPLAMNSKAGLPRFSQQNA